MKVQNGIGKLIIRSAVILTLAFIAAAAIGIGYNRHIRTEHMPDDIQYEIAVDENIWPDRFYSHEYYPHQYQSFHLDTYWTYEYGTHPLSGPVWVFHTYEIEMKDVKFSKHQIAR